MASSVGFDLRLYLATHANVQAKYKDGDEWAIECACERSKPSSKDDRGKLWVNVRKHQGYCYRCQKTLGDDSDIIKEVSQCSFAEARAIIREAASSASRLDAAIRSIDPDEFGYEAPEGHVAYDHIIELPEEFVPFRRKSSSPDYVWDRGITEEQCREYGIGWCWSGFFAHRLIVPLRDISGGLFGFVARYMSSKVPENIRKVLYPKGTKTSHHLFNERRARRHRGIIITEGVFDALRVGIRAVALFGKSASSTQLDRLIALGSTRTLIIMLDRDAHQEAKRLAADIGDACADVRIAILPDGKGDPGECTDKELRRSIKRARRIDDHAARLADIAGG